MPPTFPPETLYRFAVVYPDGRITYLDDTEGAHDDARTRAEAHSGRAYRLRCQTAVIQADDITDEEP
jgi:hypothetical protein